jgi:hypothetical protein
MRVSRSTKGKRGAGETSRDCLPTWVSLAVLEEEERSTWVRMSSREAERLKPVETRCESEAQARRTGRTES